MSKFKKILYKGMAVLMAGSLLVGGLSGLSLKAKAAGTEDAEAVICELNYSGIEAGSSVATGNTGFSRVVGTGATATAIVNETEGDKYGTFSIAGGDTSVIQALYYKTYDYDDVRVTIRMRLNDYNGKYTWQFRLGYYKDEAETQQAQEAVQMLVLDQGSLSFMGKTVDVSSWISESAQEESEAEVIESTETAEATASTEATESAETAEAAESTETAEAAESTEAAETTETPVTAAAAEGEESEAAQESPEAEATASTEAAESTETAEVTESEETAEATASTEATESAETAEVTESEETVEAAESAEAPESEETAESTAAEVTEAAESPLTVASESDLSVAAESEDAAQNKLPVGEWLEFTVAMNTVNKSASLMHGDETIVDYMTYSTNDKVSRTHPACEFRLVAQNPGTEDTSADVDYLKAVGKNLETEEVQETLLLNIDFSNGALTGTNAFGKVVGTADTATASIKEGEDDSYYATFKFTDGDKKSVIQGLSYRDFDYDTILIRTRIRLYDNRGKYTWQMRMDYQDEEGTTVEEVCKLLYINGRQLEFLGKAVDESYWAGDGDTTKLPVDEWMEFTVQLNTVNNTASLLNGETVIMDSISYTTNEKVSRASQGNNFRFVAQNKSATKTQVDVDYFTVSALTEPFVFDPWTRIELSESQTDMLSQLVSSLSDENRTHPYLYFTEEDIPALREKVTDGASKEAYQLLEQEANAELESIVLEEYTFSAALSGRRLQREVGNLAFYGYISGEQKYRDLAADLLVKAASEVTVTQAYSLNEALAVGDFLHGFAIGYDWLYNDLTEEERTIVEKAMVDFAQWIFENSFSKAWGSEEQKRLVWNWNSVTHGALGIAALVLDQDVIAENDIDLEAWLGRTIQRMDGYCTYSKDATGMSHEGLSYLGYGMHTLVPWAVGISNLTGVNWLEQFDHLKEVPTYQMWMNAPTGNGEALYLNQGTVNTHFSTTYYLINLFGDEEGLWGFNKTDYFENYYTEVYDWDGNGYQLPQIILFEDKTLEAKEPEEDDLFKVFEKGVVVGRDGWEDTSAMFSFTSAWGNQSTWNHPDTNTFAFWAKGENFIVDLGAGYKDGRQHNIVMVDGNGLNAEGGSTLCEGELKISEDYGTAVYALGDATASYTKNVKATTADRHILFGRGEEPYVFTYDDFSVEAEGEHRYTINYFTKSYNAVELLEGIQGARIDGGKNDGVCYVLFFDDDTVKITIAEEDAKYRYLTADVTSEKLGLGALFLAADKGGNMPVAEQVTTENGMELKLYLSDNRLDIITVDNGTVSYESTVYAELPEGENVIDLNEYAPEVEEDDSADDGSGSGSESGSESGSGNSGSGSAGTGSSTGSGSAGSSTDSSAGASAVSGSASSVKAPGTGDKHNTSLYVMLLALGTVLLGGAFMTKCRLRKKQEADENL